MAYRPKKGKEAELFDLVMKHGPALQVYKARHIRTGEQFFVEIFSWRDEDASGLAHTTPEIMAVGGPMTPLLESMEISVLEAA